MKPLPIVASATFAPQATEPPQGLREAVRELVPNPPRRVNRLIELALLGAHRCARGRSLAANTAIYMASTHGTVSDTVAMVRDAVRGLPSMPVTFINTSSNMAGFYVASTLGLHSGNHVGSASEFAWEATLQLMRASGGPALVGAVEECAWPLDAHRLRLGVAPGTPLLETSQWLLVDPAATAPLAWLDGVRYLPGTPALLDTLRDVPRGARLQVSGPADDATLSAIRSAAGAEPQPVAPAGHSGMPAALLCAGFIEGGARGSLVHVSGSASGAWYRIDLRKP